LQVTLSWNIAGAKEAAMKKRAKGTERSFYMLPATLKMFSLHKQIVTEIHDGSMQAHKGAMCNTWPSK
jgi:hypothetical protein